MMKLATLGLGAVLAIGLAGCAGSSTSEAEKEAAKAAIKAEVQAEVQEVINDTVTGATVDLATGKSLKETGKNAKTKVKKKAVDTAKKVDQNVTGGIGSAIYESQKEAKEAK